MLAPTLEDLRAPHAIVRDKKRGRGRPSREESGVWATCFKRCKICRKTDRPHKARGMCLRCYMRLAKRRARER